MTSAFDPTDPAVIADPYPTFDRLRSAGPVQLGADGIVYVFGYSEVQAVLRDPRFSARRLGDVREGAWRELPVTLFGSTLLNKEAPDHARLRAVVAEALTADAVAALRPRVQVLVDQLLEPALAEGELEVVGQLAERLPIEVSCELLGVPPSERGLVHRWLPGLTGFGEATLTRDSLRAINEATVELAELAGTLAQARRARPGDDVISRLVQAERDGRVGGDELIATIVGLFFAGNTTANLIASGLHALLCHPVQLARLRAEPSLMGRAVDELLRFETPAQLVCRWASEPLAVGGVGIEAGRQVVPLLGAANRDPKEFAAAGRLDLARRPNRHVAFGGGRHLCLGASLGRAELEITFATLLRTFDRLQLIEPPAYKPWFGLRGPQALPVATG